MTTHYDYSDLIDMPVYTKFTDSTGREFWRSATGVEIDAGTVEFPILVEDNQFIQAVIPQNEVRTVSSTGGEKGQKLARYDLIPAEVLHQLAEMYGRGAEKYGDNNWRLGYEWSKSFSALMRHAWQFWGGEDNDVETQLPHMLSVAFHAFALVHYMVEHPSFDDRP